MKKKDVTCTNIPNLRIDFRATTLQNESELVELFSNLTEYNHISVNINFAQNGIYFVFLFHQI